MNYLNFMKADAGELDRKSYFVGQVPCVALIMILIYLNKYINSNGMLRLVTSISAIILALYAIFSTVSRLHNAGRTGWWWLLPLIAAIMICQPSVWEDTDKRWDRSATLLLLAQILFYLTIGFHLV